MLKVIPVDTSMLHDKQTVHRVRIRWQRFHHGFQSSSTHTLTRMHSLFHSLLWARSQYWNRHFHRSWWHDRNLHRASSRTILHRCWPMAHTRHIHCQCSPRCKLSHLLQSRYNNKTLSTIVYELTKLAINWNRLWLSWYSCRLQHQRSAVRI